MSTIVDHAFDDLAHSLRVLLEANYRAHGGGLLQIDRAEAVGNIETALGAVLNAFHSLYDAIGIQFSNRPIDWYANGPLATMLALRNARHHNKANKIRTLYNFHAREFADPRRMTNYVLIDFPATEEGGDTFDVYLSWFDFKQLLSMPKSVNRLSAETCDLIKEYLGSSKFHSYARHYDLTEKHVFFNVVPLIVNAAATITPLIKDHITPLSMESDTFSILFADLGHADTHHPEVVCGPIALIN
jgi:hypothetical protein